ncbi:MAG: hypothetical protein NC401_15455 [Ruminococcus sp.]|nr:hypothetical protein [Ruminococcus sp.]
MKRPAVIFLAAITALSLCACDKADDVSGSVLESDLGSAVSSANSWESGGSTPTEQSAPEGGNSTQSLQYGDRRLTLLCEEDMPWGGGCGTESGFYGIRSNVAENGYPCITYIDYATRREVVLCSDSSCKHDSERCTAVLPRGWGTFDKLFFHDGRLYYFVTSYDEEGQMTAGQSDSEGGAYSNDPPESIPAQIYRMDPDGSNRELVYTFEGNVVAETEALGDGDCIWFVTKEPTVTRDEETGLTYKSAKNRVLVRLDLNERKIVEQIPIPEKDNVSKRVVGVCGGKVIFGGIAYPDGKGMEDYLDILAPSPVFGDTSGMDEYREFMNTCEFAFFALDVTDKTMREIYRAGFGDISLDFTQIGERLYIPPKESGAPVTVLDLNTGNTEEFPTPEGYGLDGFVGERPVFITTDGEYRRFFRDPDTGEMKDWVLEYDLSDVAAVCGEYALVIYDLAGEEQPDGSVINAYDLYALISLDDLYNGRANFEPIEMLERSR